MSRWIDADALTRRWCGMKCGCERDECGREIEPCIVVMAIEEAPTIDLADYVPKDFHDKTCEAMAKRHQEEIADILERADVDRPQGEWIDKGWKGDWQFETDGRGTCWRVFECSLCNGESTSKTRFCPHCGARMKGADDGADNI